MTEPTAQERKLLRRIDFLNEVIDRLQDGMGLVIATEAHHKDKPRTHVVFDITLAPGIWSDAHKYPVLRAAIHDTIKHHLDALLDTGHNGYVEDLILTKKTKKGF